jgi:predicted transcriptional regulator
MTALTRRRNDMARTSLAAYARVEPRSGTMEAQVLQLLREKPRTREEIALASGLKLQTVCARMRKLVIDGFAEKTGEVRGDKDKANVMRATNRQMRLI